jgi:hypothetical protein
LKPKPQDNFQIRNGPIGSACGRIFLSQQADRQDRQDPSQNVEYKEAITHLTPAACGV